MLQNFPSAWFFIVLQHPKDIYHFLFYFLAPASVLVIETMVALTVALKLYRIKVIINFVIDELDVFIESIVYLHHPLFVYVIFILIRFLGYYLDQFFFLCNLIIEIFCRAHTSINFSHWIKRCSPTSRLLGPSTEGSSFPLVMYFLSWIFHLIEIHDSIQTFYIYFVDKGTHNSRYVGVCRMDFIHSQWNFKWNISCMRRRHLVCIELRCSTGYRS